MSMLQAPNPTNIVMDPKEIALTVEQFQTVLPEKMKKSVNPQILQTLNDMLADPDMCETYRDNLIGYTTVMIDGKFKLEGYVMAVKYVSFKLMGCSNIDAYTRTFPQKMQRWTQIQNLEAKEIASYVTAYNKSKLVNLILAQTLIPTHVLNADIFQKAINVQVELMTSATSEKVRQDAANSLLTHLKAPQETKLQIDVSAATSDSIASLRASVEEHARLQREAIEFGLLTPSQVAEKRLIQSDKDTVDAEIVE